jgi:GT2 family glycosyltransferase
VIPTFNRKQVLAKAIQAHFAQSAVDEIKEILVVDDGSTDGTDCAVSALAAEAPFPLRRLHQSNRGQAAARNLGISEATGKIILFADDDIIPAPDLLIEHLRWHERHPDFQVAVMGNVTWSPDVRPTPFMKWFALDGPLFAYGHFKERLELDDFRFFYTCNLSLKTEFLRQTGAFDEDFKGYGYEDAELGYRLQKNGLRLLYNPAALAYHYKHVTFEEACHRAEQVALAFSVLKQKEAGKYLLNLEEREFSGAEPRGAVKKLIIAALHPFEGMILSLLKLIVDSRIPLPWAAYRRLYSEATMGKGERGQLQRQEANPAFPPIQDKEQRLQ